MSDPIQPPASQPHVSAFQRIRHANAAGHEYWSSREFATVLGYTDYRNFENALQKARTACFNSGLRVDDHLVDITEMIETGSDRGHTRGNCWQGWGPRPGDRAKRS